MSSDFVFEYDGASYPNIHSKPEHYMGGTLTPYAQTTNKMAAIKTRYLNMMRAQLASQQTDAKKKAFIEGMELAKFEKMEKQIENKIVEEYNKAASRLGGNIGGYNMGVDGYVAALKSGDKDGAIKSLAQIIAVFHQNKDAVALYEMLKDNPQQIYSDISINELINVQAFMKVIEAAMNGENYRNTLNSILTKPSEALAALIGTYAEAKSDADTDEETHRQHTIDKSVVEFVVDADIVTDLFPETVFSGNMEEITMLNIPIFSGKISEIRISNY